MLDVIGFIIVVATAVVVSLVIQSQTIRRKFDGEMVITQDVDGKKLFSLEIAKNPEQIEQMKSVTFKVVKPGPENYDY